MAGAARHLLAHGDAMMAKRTVVPGGGAAARGPRLCARGCRGRGGAALPSFVPRYHPGTGGAAPPQRPAPGLGEEQSFAMAFQLLDKDGDGLLSQPEAFRLLAFVNATQARRPAAAGQGAGADDAAAAAAPLHWDQHLAAGLRDAAASGRGVAGALAAFVAAKLSGRLQRRPPRASDLLWSALGMAAAMGALLAAAGHAAALPVVGPLHQQARVGLPLMLGSFGTLAVLLFARPDAEPVRAWPIVAGQLAATAVAVVAVKVLGTSVAARAAAMGAALAVMMQIDAVHPPGGALVLLAMDNKAVQALEWGYLLWPSLLLSLGVVMPLAYATNALKRAAAFDWPGAGAPPGGGGEGAAAAAAPWGAGDAERWRGAVMAPPGAAPGAGKRSR
ncbi:MAG: HPP family-domain-containing protein [Monoraphidium minutum]|nr:MAG: HPP family-domain-containing protein [Monoraphidium minutum]